MRHAVHSIRLSGPLRIAMVGPPPLHQNNGKRYSVTNMFHQCVNVLAKKGKTLDAHKVGPHTLKESNFSTLTKIIDKNNTQSVPN